LLILLQTGFSVEGYELYVDSVENPVISLNGSWYINIEPKKNFWENNDIPRKWEKIQVPGEAMMQGFSIKTDSPFVYKKEIDIPLDFKNKDVILQFDGVYGYTRVWINGHYVRDHQRIYPMAM